MNKVAREWLNTSGSEILKNISLVINDIYDLDDVEDYAEADQLSNLLLALPTKPLVSALILALNTDGDSFPFKDCVAFPDTWFSLTLNQASRKELVAQLSVVDFNEYVFTFLNGIDEGDGLLGELAIRSLLNELGYQIPRDTCFDWSPNGQHKRVTRRKIIEFKVDPIANFSGLIDAVIYYDATHWDFFLQPVTSVIERIPVETLTELMISDLIKRGIVGESLFEYACCWFRLANAPGGADELEKQLARVPADSCVISYLNSMYRFHDANYPDQFVDELKALFQRASVFVDK